MPALQPIDSDSPPPCRHCGAPAAGPCATCHAMICADCGALTGGAVKKVVVCLKCDAQGRGAVGWRAWLPVLTPILLGVGGLFVVTLLLRAC